LLQITSDDCANVKLSEYVNIAAVEYFRETGRITLDAVWIAEFFAGGGLEEDHPQQDLMAFHALVQKALLRNAAQSAREGSRDEDDFR
jgi:hypothetical protein